MLTDVFTPFSAKFPCFAGELWFTANRKAAKHLLQFHDTRPALWNHFLSQERFRLVVPDECYFQSVFCNADGLAISRDNLRYVDWARGPNYPKLLTLDDYERLQKSSAHFARKCDASFDKDIIERVKKFLVFN